MDDKMGPEETSKEDKSLSGVVTRTTEEDDNQGCNSKALLHSQTSNDENEDEKKEGKKTVDDLGCMGVDVGELRLMIQKSPSVIQCEQEELSKREAILLIGTFIALTVACTVLIIIIGAFREKKICIADLANVTKIMKQLTEEPQYCSSKSCMQISSTILQSRSTVDPCQDFYSYTCSHWSNLHPHANSDWTAEDELRMRIKVRVVKELRSGGTDKSVSIRKTKELFASCMDTDILDNGGHGALTQAIDSIGGWNLRSGWIQKSIEEQLSTLHTNYWIQILFSVRVVPDPADSGRSVIIELGRGDLTLSTLDYSNPQKEKSFLKFASNTAVIFGLSPSDAKKFAYNVFQFEDGIAKVQQQSFTAVSRTERIQITDLQLASPELNWLKYLKTSGFDVTEESYVLASNKNYLKSISAILRAANRTTFNNYVVWRLVNELSRDLNRGFRLAAVEFEMELNERAKPRWEHCYDAVVRWYKMAIGNLYSRGISYKSGLTYLISGVKEKLTDRIETNLTISEDLRESALQKLRDVRIEYVASLLEKGVDMMDTVYSFMHFTDKDTYQQKLSKLIKANSQRLTEIYRDPQIITNEWPVASTSVRPFYCRHKNKLYIPAGSLDVPIYHDQLPTYYNYATMGTRIVRQLLKVLDPDALDDDLTTIPEWLDTKTTEYDKSYGCMSKYLTSKRQSQHFSSAAILADVTAVGVAFEAYIASGGRTRIPLAAVGQSIDQTFFTSSVLAQCGSDTTRGARPTISVLHQPAFSEAFHCNAGLKEEDMCSLWNV